MTISDALDFIHGVDWRGSRPGLSRVRELMERLHHPERGLKYVHVTGTNGKGSTCAMLSGILQAAGYRTGLYTSPYIFRFNERMQIDGAAIPDEELCALVEELKPVAESMADAPTEFELVTALALLWFARKRCDIVVCEVGMGGEFDATNVIPAPEAAVLTAIGLDHTAVLGDTVEAIAATKAGIIKPGCRAVLYPAPPSVEAVVARRCQDMGVPLVTVDTEGLCLVRDTLKGQVFHWKETQSLHLSLLGSHQRRNAATVLTTVEVLRQRGWRIPEEAVRRGLAQAAWPGRFQVVRQRPTVILDGGHNPQCMASLADALEAYFPGREVTVLTGVLGDKDYGQMYLPLVPHTARFITVTPDNPRALAAEALAKTLRQYGKPVAACGSIQEGVARMMAETPPEGAAVCCGSLYLLGDAARAIDAL